jgi:S1-C subfamily serine protease
MVARHAFSAIAVSIAVVLSLSPVSDASATIPDFAGPQAPSLAPLLREVTPAVVNISVRGRVKEDNPLYQDPVFRQFFDVPKQLVRRGRVGISTQDLTPELAAAFRTKRNEGALIAEVVPKSPAEQAGIRKGDLVIAADGAPIRSATQLRNKIGLTPVGERIELAVERNGAAQTIPLRVGPASEGSADRSSGGR